MVWRNVSIYYSIKMASLDLDNIRAEQKPKRLVAFGWVCLSLWSMGCQREEIRAYRVPKEQKAPVEMAAADPHEHGPGHLTWTLPVGWEEQPAEQLRAASFS